MCLCVCVRVSYCLQIIKTYIEVDFYMYLVTLQSFLSDLECNSNINLLFRKILSRRLEFQIDLSCYLE